MTKLSKQIAIAEFCGHEIRLQHDWFYYGDADYKCRCCGRMEAPQQYPALPCTKRNYLKKRKHTLGAVEMLTDTQKVVFLMHLEDELFPGPSGITERAIGLLHAKSEQIADALLKTIGKWEEEE